MIAEPPIEKTTPPLPPEDLQRLSLVFGGIIAPSGCILLDPVVFRLGPLAFGLYREPLLWAWQPFFYAAILLGCVATVIEFFRFGGPVFLRCLLGGAFAAGAVISFVLGCYMLPTSLVGLTMLIGIFGFAPFFTFFVFFRAARRIHREVSSLRSPATSVTGLFMGAIAFLLFAGSTHFAVNASTERALAEAAEGRGNRLGVYRFIFGEHRILREYRTERSAERQKHLAAAYQQISGRDIESRLDDLDD